MKRAWRRLRSSLRRPDDAEVIAEAERLREKLHTLGGTLRNHVHELRAAVDQTEQLSAEIAMRRRQDG